MSMGEMSVTRGLRRKPLLPLWGSGLGWRDAQSRGGTSKQGWGRTYSLTSRGASGGRLRDPFLMKWCVCDWSDQRGSPVFFSRGHGMKGRLLQELASVPLPIQEVRRGT